jgi:hypothetical protein
MDAARELAASSPWTFYGLISSIDMGILYSSVAYSGLTEEPETPKKPQRKRQKKRQRKRQKKRQRKRQRMDQADGTGFPPGAIYMGPQRQPVSLRAYLQSEDWEALVVGYSLLYLLRNERVNTKLTVITRVDLVIPVSLGRRTHWTFWAYLARQA